jgi:NADH:ubiquinone oxidoreductase subunit H
VLNFLHIATPFTLHIDPGALGPALLWGILFVPPIVIGALTLLVWTFKPSWSLLKSLIVGFLLFNLLAGGLLFIWAVVEFPPLMGLIWFLGKTFGLVTLFVLMRGTLPRVRIDQLMGFAWKWLIPASLANIFVTAGAILVVAQLKGGTL